MDSALDLELINGIMETNTLEIDWMIWCIMMDVIPIRIELYLIKGVGLTVWGEVAGVNKYEVMDFDVRAIGAMISLTVKLTATLVIS